MGQLQAKQLASQHNVCCRLFDVHMFPKLHCIGGTSVAKDVSKNCMHMHMGGGDSTGGKHSVHLAERKCQQQHVTQPGPKRIRNEHTADQVEITPGMHVGVGQAVHAQEVCLKDPVASFVLAASFEHVAAPAAKAAASSPQLLPAADRQLPKP
eukprot:366558-Chlamydomonas_euryale.AAC.15